MNDIDAPITTSVRELRERAAQWMRANYGHMARSDEEEERDWYFEQSGWVYFVLSEMFDDSPKPLEEAK